MERDVQALGGNSGHPADIVLTPEPARSSALRPCGEGFSYQPSTTASTCNPCRLVEQDPGVEHLDGFGMREPDCLSTREGSVGPGATRAVPVREPCGARRSRPSRLEEGGDPRHRGFTSQQLSGRPGKGQRFSACLRPSRARREIHARCGVWVCATDEGGFLSLFRSRAT